MADPPCSPFDVALGEELRAIRERLGLTRDKAVAKLERTGGTSIGDRTLLTYEHGIRQMTVARLHELAATYGVPSPIILSDAIGRMGEDSCCPTCGRIP